MKKWLKNLLIVIGVIVVVTGGLVTYYFTCMNPKRGTAKNLVPVTPLETVFTKDEAIKDLDYTYQHVKKRHPAWLDGNEQVVSAMEQQYQQEKETLSKLEQVTTLQIWQACARMTSIMHDGHTGVYYRSQTPHFIEDVSQIHEYGMPVRIDGIPFTEIEKKCLSIVPYEVEEYALNRLNQSFIAIDFWLAGFGVDISDGVVFTFETESGEQDFTYQFVELEQVKGLDTPAAENDDKWVYFERNKEKNAAIFTLISCDYNDEYRKTVDEFWKMVFDEGIENVIVDLRGNGGGASTVANYFLSYLTVDEMKSWDYGMRFGWYFWEDSDIVVRNPERDREFAGNLYVLTDINTYSAAMDFAMLIADNDLGTLIGQASGNMPDGYGDALTFQLPNSKLTLGVSHKRWYRIDKTKTGELVEPDYLTESRGALDKAYELIGE